MSQGFEKEQGPDDTVSGGKEVAEAGQVGSSAETDIAQPLMISGNGCELFIDPDTYYRDPDLRRSIDAFFRLIGPPSDLSFLDDEW